MKHLKITLLLLLVATVTFAQKSPRKQATGTIGAATVEVDYGAPSVRDRQIWGGLEKYGKVWRAGANENTTITFDKDVTVGKNSVPAGKYGFFIIPNEEGPWVAILNKKNDAWGAMSYDEGDDVLRMELKANFVDENQELLTYSVKEKGIAFAWAKARLFIPVK